MRTQTRQMDQLIAAALASPSRNMFGAVGPRCQACSGLGRIFKPRVAFADSPLAVGQLRNTSGCTCRGSGLDLDVLQRQETEQLYARLATLESQYRRVLTSQSRRPQGKMSRQYWMEMIAYATASGTAIASSTTETILVPNVVIPANYMQDGRALRLTMTGGYGTTATPTLIFSLRWGGVAGTVMAKSSTVTLTSGVGGGASMTALWTMELMIQVRSNGSTGTVMTNGSAALFTSTAGTAGTVTNYGMPLPVVSGTTGGTTPVVATCDFTADTALSVTATWGTSNAANSIQAHTYNLESLN